MSWTEERVERLKVLWADGRSASQIAQELGEVTRNAVIGKVHRLGLSGRVKAAAPARPRKERRAAPRPAARATTVSVGNTVMKVVRELAPAPMPVVEDQQDPSVRATILTLTEYTCRWPVGDPGRSDFYFCGRASQVGVPYCQHHARVAYQPSHDRRRERQRA